MKKILFAAMLTPVVALSQNIGIGTTQPTANLHIKSDKAYIFRLVDNVDTKNGDYTLTSTDGTGKVAKTATGMFRSIVVGTMSSGTALSKNWTDSGASIILPPGRWLIQPTIALQPAADISTYTGNTNSGDIEVAGSLSDSSNFSVPSSDIEGDAKGSTSGNGLFYGVLETPINEGIMRGIIIINNSSSAPKTYHLIAKYSDNFPSNPSADIGVINFAGSAPQNLFFAIKIY